VFAGTSTVLKRIYLFSSFRFISAHFHSYVFFLSHLSRLRFSSQFGVTLSLLSRFHIRIRRFAFFLLRSLRVYRIHRIQSQRMG